MSTKPLLHVSFRPFRFSAVHYTHINYGYMLLLLPAVIHGITVYGVYAVRIEATAIAACMGADILLERLFRRSSRIYDGSAALTGLLTGMLFPPLTPWWVIIVASFSAMFLGKQLFGGAGGSPFNAVCIGWAVAMVSWPEFSDPTYGSIGFELPFSVEYSLDVLHRLGTEALKLFPVKELLLGHQAGCVGTGASLLLCIGGGIGMLLGFVPWPIPLSFLGTMAATSALFATSTSEMVALPLFHLFTGYSFMGAFFLAADFSSRPVSRLVMVWYGAVAGLLTVLFRAWGMYPEGLPFAILLVNITVPLFDKGEAPDATTVEVMRL